VAVTANWYGRGFLKVFNKEIDFDTDAIKIALLADTYTPSQSHDYFDDVVASELGATGGYTTGGKLLATLTPAYDDSTIFSLDATVDPVWTSATFTCKYAVIYDSTPGSDATNPLIAYINFGGNVSVTNGTFTITFAAGGICKVTLTIA
jgi:hypothetical protein